MSPLFCRSCGRQIPDASQFCNLCGAPQDAHSGRGGMTADAGGESPESVIFTLQPTMFFIILGYIVAVLLALLSAAAIAHFQLPLGVALALAAVLIVFPIVRHLKRQSEIYTLTTHRIEISRGLFSKITRSIPLGRIQDVTTTRSIGERLMGIGDIEIDSAAEAGKCLLRNVPKPVRHVEIILEQMKAARP